MVSARHGTNTPGDGDPDLQRGMAVRHGAASSRSGFSTPGMIIGRIPSPIRKEVRVAWARHSEIAVTPFHTTNHMLVFAARMPF